MVGGGCVVKCPWGQRSLCTFETWSRGFHRVVRWVKLQTNTRGRARSIALACRYGVKVFLGLDGAFGGDPEKPRTLVRGVVTLRL